MKKGVCAVMKKYLTIPNLITIVRFFGTIALLFISPKTYTFYVLYTLCGITDALDGTLARLMKVSTEFGAKLDSVADLLFYAVMLIKIFPMLWIGIPNWIWIWVAAVIVIRSASYIAAFINTHKFSSMHTILNKLTGFCIFLAPYFLELKILGYYCMSVCFVATLSSAQELLFHLQKGKDFEDVKLSELKKKNF